MVNTMQYAAVMYALILIRLVNSRPQILVHSITRPLAFGFDLLNAEAEFVKHVTCTSNSQTVNIIQ